MGPRLANLPEKEYLNECLNLKIHLLFSDCFCLTEVSAGGEFFLLPEIDIFISICTYVCILIYPFFCQLGIAPSTQRHRIFFPQRFGCDDNPGCQTHSSQSTHQYQFHAMCRYLLISFFSSERTNYGCDYNNNHPEDNKYFSIFLPWGLWMKNLHLVFFLDFRQPEPSTYPFTFFNLHPRILLY